MATSREALKRGFSLAHQRVVLELDFSGHLRGFTELTVTPVSDALRTVHIHSRQAHIHRVLVTPPTLPSTAAPLPAEFSHSDPLQHITLSETEGKVDVHRHTEIKRKVFSALAEGEEGELSIALPPNCVVRGASDGGQPNSPLPGTPSAQAASSAQEFAPITITIEFSVSNPSEGVQFIKPSEASPYRVPHLYTASTCPDFARCWVPCVDSLWERCTWELEFIVPRFLRAEDDEGHDEEADEPIVVVASGELIEQVAHPSNSTKTIFHYSQSLPTSVQHIAFAAGPFEVLPLTSSISTSSTSLYAFALPGSSSSLSASTSVIPRALAFYSSEHGSYPFSSFKTVFVHDPPAPVHTAATLVLLSTDLLHPPSAIEQALETRHVLAQALATQWSGINIVPRTWADVWIVQGLASYIAALFLKKTMGNNEFRFRMKKDMDRVAMTDTGRLPPLCVPNALEPPNDADAPFLALKAPLILHILDRRLAKSGTSHGLSRVIPKIFLGALSGDVALSTHHFLRVCRKVSGVDLRQFADQWIYGSGCPHFSVAAHFNRKKMCVEMSVRQESPAVGMLGEGTPEAHAMRPVQVFEGQMTIRIHEADGTPYEHVLDIRDPFKRFDVPFNTKYKRVRRNTKRFQARQAAAAAAAQGDEEAAEAIGMIDLGFGLGLWEEEAERERWRVEDWTEEDEVTMGQATYEWIRVDADFEWIAQIRFEQPDFMWVSQLQRDRDVVAQLEAVHALAAKPTKLVSSMLTRTVLVTNYFFRIRMEAAMALQRCAIPELEFIGLFHLFKIFQTRWCYPPEHETHDPFGFRCIPLANDFEDFTEYFLRKSVISTLSHVRDENGRTFPQIRQFLIDLLQYNDNSANRYSDSYYLATVINCLASAIVPTIHHETSLLLDDVDPDADDAQGLELKRAALEEVERYMGMDRLVPSFQNVVTIAGMQFNLKLMLAGQIPNDGKLFLPYTREGNYPPVRTMAFDSLLLLGAIRYKPLIQYMTAVLAYDESRTVRRRLAQSMCEAIVVLLATGDIAAVNKKEATLIEEEAQLAQAQAKAPTAKSETEKMIKGVRKELGKIASLRAGIMNVLLAPDADYEIRWTLLKLADILYKGHAEPPPRVFIHLPPTPATEAPPLSATLPKIRLSVSGEAGRAESPKPFTFEQPLPTPTIKLKQAAVPAVPKVSAPPPVPARAPAPVVPSLPTPAKKKKEKPVPQAQRAGMTATDVSACRATHKKLVNHKSAIWFHQAVDPIRDGAPNYFEIIKNPMDLSTMSAKLEGGLYKDRFAFEADFKLIIKNALTYNAGENPVSAAAKELDEFFDKQWQRVAKTLESRNAGGAPQPAPAQPASQPAPRPFPIAPPPTPSTSTLPSVSPTPSQPAPTLAVAPAPTLAVAPALAKPSISLKLKAPKPPTAPKPEASPPKPKKVKLAKPPAPAPPPEPSVDDLLAAEAHVPPPAPVPKPPKKHKRPAEPSADDLLAEEVSAMEAGSASPPKREKSKEKEREKSKEKEREKSKEKERERDKPPKEKSSKKKDGVVAAAVPSAPTAPSASLPPVPTSSSAASVTRAPSEAPSAGSGSRHGSRPPSAPPGGRPIDFKKCKQVLKKLMAIPESLIFNQPVDPILNGCPTYWDEIKHPMDFGTIMAKLDAKKYLTMEQFAADVELVYANCRKFNGDGAVSELTRATCDPSERFWGKEWRAANTPKLAPNEKRAASAMIKQLKQQDSAVWFLAPVDPVALNIPMYFEVIPRKDARDLSLILSKLEKDQYADLDALEADVQLMLHNAIKFNGLNSPVGEAAERFGAVFAQAIGELRGKVSSSSGGTKRKEAGAGDGRSSKKAKFG